VDLIHGTYLYGIPQLSTKDRSLANAVSLIFFALTVMAMHHCLSAWKIGEFLIPPDIGLGCDAELESETKNTSYAMNNLCPVVFGHHNMHCLSLPPKVEVAEVNNIRSLIHLRIHSTGTDPAMVQPHENLGSIHENLFYFIPEKLIEQSNKTFKHHSSFVAAMEANMHFSAVLPLGWSAIASSSCPITNNDSISNNITHLTDITHMDNTRLFNGRKIIEAAILIGG
jgi:hypothetical protein